MVTTRVMYITCKHRKIKSLETSLGLQQIKEVGVVAKQEHDCIMHNIECTCKIQWCTIFMLHLLILGIIIFIILNAMKLKLFRGHLFSNAVKIMMFLSDAQYYVPVKLCRTAGSIHLITGKLTPKHIKLKRNILWDVIELAQKEVNMTLNGNKINLPTSVIMPLRDKFKLRCIVKQESLLFHIMLKQCMTWFPLVTNDSPETA